MACSGASTESCGGPNRLTVFKANSGAPSHASTIPGWKYVGCRTDSVNSRTLTSGQLYDGTMTLEKCAAYCINSMYFGAEYASECYCGDKLAASSSTTDDGDCSMKCGGNSTEYCGAGNRLSVYAKST